MFYGYVRSSPCPAPNSQSSPLLHAACAAVARRLPPPDWYTSPRTACPPSDSRQGGSAFNQPLSFDTSSVTTMYGMFYVRSSPCPAPNLQSSPPLHAACTAAGRRPPASLAIVSTAAASAAFAAVVFDVPAAALPTALLPLRVLLLRLLPLYYPLSMARCLFSR